MTHHHVEETLYALEGQCEVWRKTAGAEDTGHVSDGTSLTIPPHTAFQFRNMGVDALRIFIVTMPRWPGRQEAGRSAFGLPKRVCMEKRKSLRA